jgi:hypothetical protein
VVSGGTLRALRRARGWDVPEAVRQLRHAAHPEVLPVHLDQMIRAWERGTTPRERYWLLLLKILPELRDANGAGPEPDPADVLDHARHAPGRAEIAALATAAARSGKTELAALADGLMMLQRQVDDARQRLEHLLAEQEASGE